MRDPASRARVHTALESFASYTLFELDHATQLLTEVRRHSCTCFLNARTSTDILELSGGQIWALRDAGNTWTTWRDIAGREGGFALV